MSNGPKFCPPFCAGAVVTRTYGKRKMAVIGEVADYIHCGWTTKKGAAREQLFKPEDLVVHTEG